MASAPESRLKLGAADASTWLACTELEVARETPVEFLGAAGGRWQVWLNGQAIHQRDLERPFQLDAERFPAALVPGTNRLLVQVSAGKGNADFHLRFRRKSSAAEHEKLIQAALTRKGNVERGRKLFLDAEKSQCLKCHRLQDQGEKVGPELTNLGNRFTPIYIVESILEPSRTIAPSFESTTVVMKDGRLLAGVKVDETAAALTLVDNQGQKHALAKTAIDERLPNPTSTMPEGLEKRLTLDEFVDLIAFLTAARSGP
jgi:putative heme-binding domain-containing protein